MINVKYLAERTGKSEVQIRRMLRKSKIEKAQKDRFWNIDEDKDKQEIEKLFGIDLPRGNKKGEA